MNLVTNGDFESGNLDNWFAHYAYVGYTTNKFGKTRRTVDYLTTRPNQPPPTIVNGSSKLPEQATPIVPFEGTQMARINDLVGDNHVTCLHQTITLPSDFNEACAFVSFRWGAMLGGSTHDADDRPKFAFDINVKRKVTRKDKVLEMRWKGFLHIEYTAPDSAVDGWTDIREASQKEAVWFKKGTEKQGLYGLKAGETIRIRFIAEDCTGGQHGGAAFIDDVKITDGCTPGSPCASPIPDITIPNVFSPNNDQANDVFGLNGVQGACLIEFNVYDRWGDLIFFASRQSLDGTWPSFIPLWDGLIRTRRRLKGIGKRKRYYRRKISPKDMKSGTVF
jgi:gliding motility-associated-like protein